MYILFIIYRQDGYKKNERGSKIDILYHTFDYMKAKMKYIEKYTTEYIKFIKKVIEENPKFSKSYILEEPRFHWNKFKKIYYESGYKDMSMYDVEKFFNFFKDNNNDIWKSEYIDVPLFEVQIVKVQNEKSLENISEFIKVEIEAIEN
tara:strand:+ start:80 stop:523 length:444 start_codon:yes stop_codon:yes gene_type:complete